MEGKSLSVEGKLSVEKTKLSVYSGGGDSADTTTGSSPDTKADRPPKLGTATPQTEYYHW